MTIEERNKLVLDNQNLVHYVLQKYCHIYFNSPNYEDLYQTGCIGLIHAIDNFDPDRGIKLSTYAAAFIYGTIRRYKREELAPYGIVIPRPLKDKIFKSIKEDEDISNWSMYEQNAYLILTNQVTSLDTEIVSKDDKSSSSLYEIILDETSYTSFDELEMQEIFDKFLESLEGNIHYDIMEEILYDRLYSGGKGDPQELLGKKYNLSQAQISRIIQEMKVKFKNFIK